MLLCDPEGSAHVLQHPIVMRCRLHVGHTVCVMCCTSAVPTLGTATRRGHGCWVRLCTLRVVKEPPSSLIPVGEGIADQGMNSQGQEERTRGSSHCHFGDCDPSCESEKSLLQELKKEKIKLDTAHDFGLFGETAELCSNLTTRNKSAASPPFASFPETPIRQLPGPPWWEKPC